MSQVGGRGQSFKGLSFTGIRWQLIGVKKRSTSPSFQGDPWVRIFKEGAHKKPRIMGISAKFVEVRLF